MMDISNIYVSQSEKKINNITLLLVLVGAVTSLCLIFFFTQLFKARHNSVTPKIFNVEQIGATQSSVLIVWSSSEAAEEFIVRYRSTDSMDYTELKTDKPFAALRDLQPYKRYKAVVTPVNADREFDPFTVICNTSPYCHVTDVFTDEVTSSSVHVTWNFDGIDEGFTIAAYAVDKNGKRHVTSEKTVVSPGSKHECTLNNLLSELNYTVCVMPNTRYATAGKSTFTTDKYSKEYNSLNVIRVVMCPYDSDDSMHVKSLNQLNSQQDYKTSIIISGQADSKDTIEIKTYITDLEGNIISDFTKKNVLTNPEDKPYFSYRTILTDFKSPVQPGNYLLYTAFDGITVRKLNFKVI